MSVFTPMFTVPVQLLLDHSVDVNTIENTYGSTMLHVATVADDVELVQQLLEKGADPNIRCRSRRETPIEEARRFPSHRNHRAIVDLLLRYGAIDSPPPE